MTFFRRNPSTAAVAEITYKKTPVIHLRQLPVISTINVLVLVCQLVSFQGRFGIDDCRVNAKDKDHKSKKGCDAGVRFHVKSQEQKNLIHKTELLRVSDSRWFGMELLHLEGHDIVTLLLFAVAAVHIYWSLIISSCSRGCDRAGGQFCQRFDSPGVCGCLA